jgi:galactonate dehydratase
MLNGTMKSQVTANTTIRQVSGYGLREPASQRAYSLLRVETAGGVFGWGECPRLTRSEFLAAKNAVGKSSATAIEPVCQKLASMPRVRAAFNMALLDISGKLASAPAYQVLGGPTRNKARALVRLAGDGDALQTALDRGLEAGFRTFGVPLPVMQTEFRRSDAFVKEVVRRIEALRREAGGAVDFVLEGDSSLTPGEAATVAAAIEPFHALWFDEPCGLSNLATVRKIADESVTPLGFGRDYTTGGEFQDLLREGLADVLRPDICLNGITDIRRIAAMAETYYVAVAPFHDGGPVATAAALQLAASLPNFFIQQIPLPMDPRDRQMRADLTNGSVEEVHEGFAKLPTGAGLGIEVDMDAMRKHGEELA